MEQNNKYEEFETRLTRLEVLMQEMIKKQDEFNECYKSLPREVIVLQEENKTQQKEIDELNNKFKGITGALVTIAVGLVVALLKSLLNI